MEYMEIVLKLFLLVVHNSNVIYIFNGKGKVSDEVSDLVITTYQAWKVCSYL